MFTPLEKNLHYCPVVTNLCLRHLFFSFKGDLTCVQDKKNLFWYNSGVVQWGHNSSFSCCKIKRIIFISITSLSCEFTCSCRWLGMVLLFSVFSSQIIFFFKRSILQKYSSPCSIYWISWQILVNCRNIGTGTPHWHNFLKCWINHFALVSHYVVWRYLENDAVELDWNETMTFRIKKTRCKDYSEKEKTFFAIQFNISWFLPILRMNDFYLSLSSHTEQYVAGKLFQSKSVQTKKR